ncbi:unnamed protein product [Lymnaea stagnalis]|uniref:Nucleolar protein 14 n=1 Tax=Lymnaea stagnalis TaxID=6523 RepID=A0AAV2I5K6_LYMST
MGKKGLSDKVRNKQKNKAKQPPNPFEVKINKVKHSVVNKKLQKWEKGLPGVSRSKAIKKRKDTILKELYHLKKSNTLHDKRIGESDSALTADEKMVQRFALEKKKQMRKSDFNLNEEEEVLTHYGQSLGENLQDTIGSEDEDDNDGGKFKTGDLQFGGFSKDGEVSWKDKMKEVIADSKKQKYERQAEKEKTLETTNELDKSWKSIVTNLNPVVRDKLTNQRKASNFMQLFHNLVMDQKSSGASDKLKTEEEKAKEEAEKLLKLESQRIARMNAGSKSSVTTHKSADDLSDGFTVEKPQRIISFGQNGVMLENDEDEENDENVTAQENEDEEEDGDDDDEEDEGSEGSSDEEGSDNYSDLASDDGSGGSDEETGDQPKHAKKRPTDSEPLKSILKSAKVTVNTGDNNCKAELPFIFAAPGSYDELKSLLHGHSGEEQAIIISRLRKCHHPSLAEGNKEKLEKIHLYLLEYFGELLQQQVVDRQLIHHVTASLWEMSQTFPASTASALQKLVTDRQKEFTIKAQSRGGRGTFVKLDTLMYLVLIESLFPTSDFKHSVTTPAIHFITQQLAECSVRNGQDAVSGLFLCSLALKYVCLSKRYIPEVITFLHGILYLGAAKNKGLYLRVFPPFRESGKGIDLLKVQHECNSFKLASQEQIMIFLYFNFLLITEMLCHAISTCLDLLVQCMTTWEDLPCLRFILNPLKLPLSLLPKHLYPKDVQSKCESLVKKIQESESKTLKVLQPPSTKPIPLKLFEPEVDEFWSGKRKKKGPNREENERKRLSHKYKREMKAAVREIKRDNEVLARHQLDTVLQKSVHIYTQNSTIIFFICMILLHVIFNHYHIYLFLIK